MKIRIGSRQSRLAVAQTELVAKLIEKEYPEVETEIVTMKTTGDKILTKSLELIGGKGLFVKELEQALREGRIDLAVHSLKDLPMEMPEDLPVLAYTKREDPRDVLVLRKGLMKLPEGPRIGTCSRRRKMQMGRMDPGIRFTDLRGNVQTRLRKLEEQNLDGTVLAAAGLKRLHMEEQITEYYSVEMMVPAAGQGILAVQGRNTPGNAALAACIDCEKSRAEAAAERAFVRVLGGGCNSPIAAHARTDGERLFLTGLYYEEGAEDYFTGQEEGSLLTAEQTGTRLAEKMRGNCYQGG